MKKSAYNRPAVVKTSATTKKELQRIIESLKGKELFKEKVESAKKILATIKTLPV